MIIVAVLLRQSLFIERIISYANPRRESVFKYLTISKTDWAEHSRTVVDGRNHTYHLSCLFASIIK